MTDQQHTTEQQSLPLELREPVPAPRWAEALELEYETEHTQDRGRWGA